MIDREHDLSITKQAEILKISRGSVYYLPRPVSSADLEIMRQLDQLHLEYPFAGSRMLRGLLALQGCKVGRRHVKTLMRRMGIEALYRRPRTTKPEPGHKIHPYLLRGLEITRPNQVWAMDITYIPMAHGFVYLAVVLDWATRRVLSWRLSITMEAAFCVETLEDALACHGRPDIFNTDKARSSPVRPLPVSSPTTASPSAWMAKELGETTCSSRGFGKASNTRRSICEPTKPSVRREARLVDISTFTTGDDRIRALTTAPRIKPTSIFLRSARRPNPGRRSTYRRGIIVQTTGTGSVHCRNADRIRYRRIALAAAARMVMRWLARSHRGAARFEPPRRPGVQS
jgi:putative transposase